LLKKVELKGGSRKSSNRQAHDKWQKPNRVYPLTEEQLLKREKEKIDQEKSNGANARRSAERPKRACTGASNYPRNLAEKGCGKR